MSTIDGLLAQLRPQSKPEDRTYAARMLSQQSSLPATAAAPLVETLSDDASWYEEWTDWDGTVTGGTAYFARDYARAALLTLGAPALEVLRHHPAHRALLAEIVAAASPEALGALSPDTLAALPSLVMGTPSEKAALQALRWRDANGASETERLMGRLAHESDAVVAEACLALARQLPSTAISDAVFSRLCRPLPAAEGVLEALAPRASDAALTRFLSARVGPKDDPPFQVLRAVLAWGPRARPAAEALVTLLLRKLRSSNVVMDATLPAMVVAATLGPPTNADDVRVRTFLTAREKIRGVEQPPPEALELLVKASGGGAHVAPLVLDELTKKLIDGPNEARVDAVARLFALRQAAEPAGDALLVALDALIAANWTMAVSSACWTLAHAGAANQRALPKFIAMLEGPHAFSAMHGLHGMSEDAAEAIPAVEALLARTQSNVDRETANRLLKRIRHLARAR